MKITSHRAEAFSLDNFNIDRVFDTIERMDYLVLYYIKSCAEQDGRDDRVYLSELAEAMNLKIPELSRKMEGLQNRGYVRWQTDYQEGRTYVELTSKAVELMLAERQRMRDCYERIQEEIGPEEVKRTIRTMRKITQILSDTGTGA
ncbi:MAG: MarR family winged helix-turn-helix transcriptional regulator [Oscillospiraceae bacterium]|nr:MarR family winged helix-turn-helix transcriptional regulator [Oscillospiraceae bacterium]